MTSSLYSLQKQCISAIKKLTLTVESHDDDTSKFSCMDNCEMASSCASDVFSVRPYSKLYTYLHTTIQNTVLCNNNNEKLAM